MSQRTRSHTHTPLMAPARAAEMPEFAAALSAWLDSDHGAQVNYENALSQGFDLTPIEWMPIHRVVAVGVRAFPLYWVTAEMARLLASAVPTFPEQTDVTAPTPQGFAFFDKPLVWTDIPDSSRIWGLEWSTDWFCLWTKRDAEPLCFTVPLPTEKDFPWREDTSSEVYWAFRIRGAFFTLVSQRVATCDRRRPDRAARRRAARMGMVSTDVQVIDLRRTEPTTKPSAENPVDWSHRWVVDGHWRNQYLPSSKAHRPTWIAPYVKGPDDKPLVVRKRTYKWSR